jgi:hypothetical protein
LDAGGVTVTEGPYYESRFLRANDPDAPRAVWLRETLLLPTVGEPSADVWVMVFDPSGHRAVKQRFGIEDADFSNDGWTARIASTSLDDAEAVGMLADARWDLSITPGGHEPVRVLSERG